MPLGVQHRRTIRRQANFMHGHCQARIVHAGNAPGNSRKADGREGMFALGPMDGDQPVSIEDPQRVEVEIAPEENAARLALARLDHERRTGKAAPVQVHNRIGDGK